MHTKEFGAKTVYFKPTAMGGGPVHNILTENGYIRLFIHYFMELGP